MSNGRKKQHPRWMYFSLLAIIAVCLGIIITLLPDGFQERSEAVEPEAPPPATVSDTEAPAEEAEPTADAKTASEKEPIPIYIVIDDVGNNLAQIEPFLEFEGEMTFAIMPNRPFTTRLAETASREGYEVIMHQPMEPDGNQDPGLSAIYTSMTAEEIRSLLDDNFAGIPGAVGMNNHMGSKATADPETMKAVFSYMAEKNLFFLDSVTTLDSVAQEEASAAGVPYARRNSLFLDNDQNPEAINEKIDEGLEKARRDGHAVLIGHVWNDNLAKVLTQRYLSIIDDGFRFGSLSELYKRSTTG